MNSSARICKWLVVSIVAVFAAVISSHAQSADCTPPPTGLVSWWRAEGNGLDSIGGNTAYAALLPGGVTFGAGEVGQGFKLPSTNAYLIVPASPSLNIGAGGGLTLEAWINLTNADGYHPILEWNNSARLGGVMLWVLPGKTLFANVVDTNQNSHSFASVNGTISANVFQHVALTYDRATGIGTLYLNGAIVAKSTLGSFTPETTFNLWFGYRPGDVPGDATYGSYFGGILDEVSLYNRALGSNEIAGIYNAGAAGKCSGSSSNAAPLITHQPTNQTVAAGANATFTVAATGSPILHYQWYGPSQALISGATNTTLTLSDVQPGAAGAYFVLVTNQFGSAISSNAVLTVTGGSSNSCTPPPSGLVGWWKGENNTQDSAGSNNGFAVGGSIGYAPGKVGSAFHYGNSGSYVAVPPTPSLNVGLGAGFTLEAWIQPDDLQNQMPLFEWQYDTNTDANGIHFWISSQNGPGCLFANIVDSNFNSHWIYSAPGIITGDYQHVALTYNKTNGVASMYRNGVLVVSQNLGSFTPNTTGNLLLGERTFLAGEPQFHYVGGLDEMSVYSRVLSPNEIAAIYNAGSAGKCSGNNSGSAPVITHQPTNQTVNVGGTATFSVTATGSPAVALHFQWYGPNSALIPGATQPTLILSNVQPSAAGMYFVFVTNQFGFAQSSNAVLTVNGSGSSATGLIVPNYSVSNQVYNPAGTMNQPLRMQMVYGASQFPSYPIVITELRWRPDVNAGGPLSVIVSNLLIKLSTTVATADHLSTIFTQNTGTNETVAYNGSASISTAFTTLSNGTKAFDISIPLQTPFTFDPSKGNLLIDLRNLYGCIPARTVQSNIVNSTGLNDAVSRVFSVNPNATNAETADTGADVLQIIYTPATNTASAAPLITKQPTNQTVNAGGNASFTVTATGSPTLHYQWYAPGESLIPGATASTLLLSNVQPADAGAYFVLVTNQFGFAISSNAVLTVTGGGGGGTNSCTPPPSGIAAWWRAESNTIDSINGNNGTINGGVTYVDNIVGHAFLFDGTNGYISVPASPSLNIGAGSGLTIECWIKPNHLGPIGEEGRPIVEYDTTSEIGVHLYFESGNRLYANVRDTAGNDHSIISSSGTLNSNVLSHVAVTYDRTNGTGFLYINGEQVASNYLGNFTPQTTYPLSIGKRAALGYPGSSVVYNGVLDELSLYSRALNRGELAAIYNAGANGKCPPTDSGIAPTITSQPTNQTVTVGANVTFTSAATGSPTLHYQWYAPGQTLIPGATSSSLTLSNVQTANAGAYFVFVTNSFGFAQSSNAVLTVIGTAPVITGQPTNQTAAAGANVAFAVTATGTSPLHYQWYAPGQALIPGATASTLLLSNIQPADAGAYFALVTNQFGFALSSNAVLTVTGGGSNSCTTAPTNIAAWWPAEGNGLDIVGGATVTLNGGATFAPGKVGQAFLLGGTNDYLSASSSNLNIAAGGSFTVETWINVPDVTDYHPIVEWNDGAGHGGVHLWILPYSGETPGVLFANVVDTSGGSHAFNSPGGSVSTNVFQHVALTYDQSSGASTIYVNGNIVAQSTLGSFTPQTSYPFWAGHRPGDIPGNATYGAHLGGLLDELSLYRRALSQSEITAIYNAGANGKCPPSIAVPHAVLNPQPMVTMSTAGKSPVLSWPVSASDFILQSTDDLTPPITWTNVPATLQTNGNNIEVMLPEGSEHGYFRLYHP